MNKNVIPKTINTMVDFYRLLNKMKKNPDLYLFRGQENADWDLESSWLRKELSKVEFKNEEEKNKKRRSIRCNINIFNDIITKIQKKKYWKKDYLSILSELQHSNDVSTPLIDFTNNILTAFWFALGNHDYSKNYGAKIFILEKGDSIVKKNIIKISNESLKNIFKSPNVSNRAIAQNSYFILDSIFWFDTDKIKQIYISYEVIEQIKRYLKNKKINHEFVYPDLKGAFLDAESESPTKYFLKANNTKDLNEQISFYSQAIELGPDKSSVYNNRGQAYLERNNEGDIDKAILDFKKSILLNPRVKSTYLNIADAYKYKGWTYLNKTPKNKQNISSKFYYKAIENFTKGLEFGPKDIDYIDRGCCYVALKQHNKAIEDFTKAIEINYKNIEALKNRGNSYFYLEKYNNAIEDFSKAIELDPNDVDAYINRGVIYAKTGENDKAIIDFSKAIELDPNLAAAYYNRGLIYAKTGENDKAIIDFSKAIELDPNLAAAYYNRGVSYNARGAYYDNKNERDKAIHEYNSAVNDFNKTIALDPNNFMAYNNRGTIFVKLNQLDNCN